METNPDSTPGNPNNYGIVVTVTTRNGDTSSHTIQFQVYPNCNIETMTIPSSTFALTEDTYTIYAAE